MAYLHKKYLKKFANVESHEPDPVPERRSSTDHGASLKHSIGSMVEAGAARVSRHSPGADISDTGSESRHVPVPTAPLPSKPRPYPIEPHPVYSRPEPGLVLPHHPDPSLVLLPSHLVKQPGPGPGLLPVPRLVVPQVAGYPPHPAYHLPPGIRFLDPAALPLSLNGGLPVVAHRPKPEPVSPFGHSPQLVKPRFERPQAQDLRQPEASHHFPPGLAGVYLGKDIRDPRVQADRRELDQVTRMASSSSSSSQLSAETLEQRINKVISENQAIVETLDPFWKGRYMRQSSREEAVRREGERTRRFSQGLPGPLLEQELPSQQQQIEKNRQIKSHSHLPPNSYKEHSQDISAGKYISNNVPQPPRPDSNIPLNLSDSGRKRKSPENPLIDAHSVKEVWLNSQKKTGNISQLEDIASKIEAKLRSSENPFHPENPEGSIIKDLLLKTRSGQIFVASTSEHSDQERVLKLAESANIPVNLQISPSGKAVCESDLPQHAVGIPIPKNFLPAQTKPSGSVEASFYQCKLCNVTFKSLESIEIHQNHYCKNTKHTNIEVLRPNSTVSHASPRDIREPQPRVFPAGSGSGERRKVESLALAPGEPPGKRPRADSYTGAGLVNGPANVTVTNTGLLQIAAPRGGGVVVMSGGHSTATATSRPSVPGIPTPNLSGVLTGIKSQPLFSLPGVRTDLTGVHIPEAVPVKSGVNAEPGPEKPVTFVLGIPGPHSQHLPVSLVMAQSRLAHPVLTSSSSGHPNHVALPSLNVDTTVPVRSSLNIHNPVVVSVPTLQSPARLVTALSGAGQRQMISSPQRKYEFLASTGPESPQKPVSASIISPATRDQKPERPDSLALSSGPSLKKKDLGMSGATLISPETPRPKKAYVLSYQNGTAYTFLGLKCSTRVFFCSSHKPQPNYVQLEKNSKVSMYSNWKVVAKDSHPSGLSPRLGMSAYNSTHHSSLYGITAMAAPKKSLMITTHSSRWHERKAHSHAQTSSFSVDNKKSHSTSEVILQKLKLNANYNIYYFRRVRVQRL